MRRRIPKSTFLPVILLIYLGVMSYIGYGEYASGRTSATYYFGIIILTLFVILLLHIFLKKRERYRREREEDMKK